MLLSAVAEASVIGKPQCTMDVKIETQDNGTVTGSFINVKSTAMFPNPFCKQFKNNNVEITGDDNYAKAMMDRAEHLTMGVQQGSSMGVNGPVLFIHWEVVNIKEGGKFAAKTVLPYVRVKIIE